MYLFASRQGWNPNIGAYGIMKIYSCQIYDGTTLVHNFVPARRDSDDVLGLYDTVNDSFCTNAGTGSFVDDGGIAATYTAVEYLQSDGNTDRLFELLDVAKANEPNNASLWYVEGNIRLKMDPPQVEEAFAAYDHCGEINPDYEYGYIGKGVYLYNHAVEVQEKASFEMDDRKYEALVQEYDKTLKDAIVPFEKAYEVSKDNEIKLTIAEYIKNACFRFRDDPEYQAKYEKFSEIVANGK